jgi:AcrR family transcriptional regulator
VTETRKPGRPRNAEADKSILRATLELLATEGLRGLSVEQVAERAGVGKTTVYRRWPTKRELAEAALDFLATGIRPADLPDTGSARGDLLEFATFRLKVLPRTRLHRLMPRLAIESADDAELYRLIRKIMIEPERAPLREIFRRGVERGELRADLDLDVAVDALIGPMVYRLLISRSRLTGARDRADAVIDFLLRGATS